MAGLPAGGSARPGPRTRPDSGRSGGTVGGPEAGPPMTRADRPSKTPTYFAASPESSWCFIRSIRFPSPAAAMRPGKRSSPRALLRRSEPAGLAHSGSTVSESVPGEFGSPGMTWSGGSRRLTLRGVGSPPPCPRPIGPGRAGCSPFHPRAVHPGASPQGSSAFFWEIRRRTRSASSAPSNGFLKASLKPSAKVSSPGSSLVRASRIVP